MLFCIVNIVRMSAGGLPKSFRLAKIEPKEKLKWTKEPEVTNLEWP